METMLSKIRNLDAYPKINEDFFSRTLSGGLITVVSSLFILLLVFSELSSYLRTSVDTKLIVDTSRGGRLHINFDVTFPHVTCSLVGLDAMDISGERHFDIRHDIYKRRIDSHGNEIEVKKDQIGSHKIEKPLQRHGGRLEKDEKYCGSCYGAEAADDDCCNSCEEVREAYRKKGWGLTNTDMIDQCKREGFVDRVKSEQGEGCNIHGSLEVNKVAGNFHFATGKSFHLSGFNLFELLGLENDAHNISHKINKLAFGDYYPGIKNPLDGVQWNQGAQSGVYQYFLKVVPTIYTDIRGRKIHSNQFSVTEHFKSTEFGVPHAPPGVYFYYDISPIKVTFTENHEPFLHFITYLCAIIGGIFTVAGIVDSFVYHGHKALKKAQIGKFS